VSSPARLADGLDAALPQTQCTRCGYPDCRAYARAMAEGSAPINRCPPGGAEGIVRLAGIVGKPVLPLDPAHGTEGPRRLAVIDEAWCIGCTLCLKACPVDCIVGGPKQMHTVIESQCTGCELCIPACPVDCISLENASGSRTGWDAWSPEDADAARRRHEFHRLRLARDERERRERLAARARSAPALQGDAAPPAGPEPQPADARQAAIAAALARARARRST